MALPKKANTTGIRQPLKGKVFTSEYQPTGEAKSKGKLKSRLIKDLLELAFTGPHGGKLKKAAATYLNIPEESLTVEDMMHFRQIEKAVGKSNTFAYMAVMDRAFGKPKQVTEEIGEPKKFIVTIKK